MCNWFEERFSNIGKWFEDLGINIGNWFKDLWTNIDNGLRSLSEDFNNGLTSIGNWFSNLGQGIKDFFIKKDTDERNETNDKTSDMESKTQEVNGIISNKFGAFYTLKDFLVDFWNSIQDSGDTPPEFKLTLPEFCGGATVNAIDFTFYNNYRSYIHGIIAGICYYVYIKRIIREIPYIIH